MVTRPFPVPRGAMPQGDGDPGGGEGGTLPQDVAGYQEPAPGEDHCADCAHFQAPDSCKYVASPIAEQGWCKIFDDGMNEKGAEMPGDEQLGAAGAQLKGQEPNGSNFT